MSIFHLMGVLLMQIVAATDDKALYCYSCLDVTILESDREANNAVISLYDTYVKYVFDGADPGTCNSTSVVKCSDKETTCLLFQSILEGTYYGIRGRADVKVAKCLDLTTHGFSLIDQRGCLPNTEAWDLTEWAKMIDFEFTEDPTGVTCTSDESLQNHPDDDKALYCYSCLDITILESEREANSTVISLYDTFVNSLFDGADPAACTSPSVVKCSDKETTCWLVDTIIEGSYYGIQGRAEVEIAKCLDLTTYGYRLLDQRGCLPNTEAWDLTEWVEIIDFEFTEDIPGVTCTSDESLQIHPDDGVTLCSYCKDITVNFEDSTLNSKIQIAMLMNVFEPNTPWCPHPGDVECPMDGSCTTLSVTIHGKYDGKSGRVTITHHDCMTAAELERSGLQFTSQCKSVTADVLAQIYGDTVTHAFSSVDTVEGSLCPCHKDLCNLPKRLPEMTTPSSGTKSQLSVIALVMMILVVRSNLLL